MTPEDKELLLKDVSARLPYGVFVHYILFDEYSLIGRVYLWTDECFYIKKTDKYSDDWTWTNEDDAEKSIVDTTSLQKAIFNAALQAMQWKDEQFEQERQQWIDKACEWIKDNINYYLDWYDWGKCMVNKGELIDDICKAMKGE